MYEQRGYWRNPAGAFFTFLFPLLFLVAFATINKNQRLPMLGNINYNQFYVPSIIAFGVMSATFANIAIGMVARREAGVLKRLRGTPLPTWIFVAAVIASSMLLSLLIVAIVATIGVAFYGVQAYPDRFGLLLVVLVVGAFCFSALGLAMSNVVPNVQAAPAIVYGIFLPLLFISSTFFPIDSSLAISKVAGIFPIRHFDQAIFAAFDPMKSSPAFPFTDVLVIGIWGVLGAIAAVRFFRWAPRR
jgi:ABC-2 type transport system permease protein